MDGTKGVTLALRVRWIGFNVSRKSSTMDGDVAFGTNHLYGVVVADLSVSRKVVTPVLDD